MISKVDFVKVCVTRLSPVVQINNKQFTISMLLWSGETVYVYALSTFIYHL